MGMCNFNCKSTKHPNVRVQWYKIGYYKMTLNSFARISINQIYNEIAFSFFIPKFYRIGVPFLRSATGDTHFCWNHLFYWAPFYCWGRLSLAEVTPLLLGGTCF